MHQLLKTTVLLENNGPQWTFPTDQNLQQEYAVEYKKHIQPFLGNLFPTFEDFYRACKAGRPTEVTPSLDHHIGNRSRTSNQKDLLNLIRSYRSYPEFRNEGTIQNLYDRVKAGENLDMPIVLVHRGTGEMVVMGGNTRMDVAFQLGVNPTVLMVHYE